METKKCSKCEKIKDINEFSLRNDSTDGFKGCCKDCERKRLREYNKNNPKKASEKGKRFNRTLKGKIKSWKRSGSKRGFEWDLDYDFLNSIPLVCAYTDEILTMETNNLNTISLDRIDNTKNYEKDNVVLCCEIVNSMKRDLTKEELILWCGKIWNNRDKILSIGTKNNFENPLDK